MINDDLFDRFQALTFDDVVIVPGHRAVFPVKISHIDRKSVV